MLLPKVSTSFHMPKKPEYIGKAHEKLTRDILNNNDKQPDTKEMLSKLDDSDLNRVQIAAEKSAEFVNSKTDFEIKQSFEVGDSRKNNSEDDTDLLVKGNEEEKEYSLKTTSSTAINVRNTLASVMCKNIFEETIDSLFNKEEYSTYSELTQKFVEEEISGSDMAEEITKIFESKFNEFKQEDRERLTSNLLNELRLDSNMVACKVTKSGKFYGFASKEREVFNKFREGEGELRIYTKDSNNTSIFFEIDGESIFRIDMYGQYQGSERSPRIKTVFRVTFGDESNSKQSKLG